MNTPALPYAEQPPRRCDIAVIGSGAGGAVTAATLAEGGRQTVILEEGMPYAQTTAAPFSMAEMLAAYRRQGMTAALGESPVNYVEGRCVGGGTEINSGLYHRPPREALARWAAGGVHGADSSDIQTICAENEKALGITKMPGGAPPAAMRLAAGAEALGLRCAEIPRWHDYDESFTPTAPGGLRRSMSRTFLPRFIRAGGEIVAGCEVKTLRQTADGWQINARFGGRARVIHAREVFAAAGAVRTPFLLRRSGFRRRIGNTLRLHVFTRVVAEFPAGGAPVNAQNAGIGAHQIDALAPRLRFGCGVSTAAHLAAAFAQCGSDDWLRAHAEKWPYRCAYYAAIGGGRGWVRNIGGSEAVFYRLSPSDYYDLADGARLLCRLLFRAGAVKVLPIIKGAQTLHCEKELWRLPRPLAPARACLTSVHLLGSCPMGAAGATDSYGALIGARGLYIADASLFCDSPNVNPQGTVMAFARRNAIRFLSDTR